MPVRVNVACPRGANALGFSNSRYWGGNEDETSLIIKTAQEQMHVDFMGTEHEDICRLLDGRPVLVRDRESKEYYYIIQVSQVKN